MSRFNQHRKMHDSAHSIGLIRHAKSLILRPDRVLEDKERIQVSNPKCNLHLDPMSDLDLAIANGWGNVPQDRLPVDWRVRKRGQK